MYGCFIYLLLHNKPFQNSGVKTQSSIISHNSVGQKFGQGVAECSSAPHGTIWGLTRLHSTSSEAELEGPRRLPSRV